MRKIITEDKWLRIKTDYQLGVGIRELERKYDIPASTIKSRQKREEWTQEPHAKLIELQGVTQDFVQSFAQEQLPFVQEKLDEVLSLQKKVNSFIGMGIDLNIKNMQAVLTEQDDEKRINLTARMKATMADLAGVSQQRPSIPKDEETDSEKVGIKFYLPKRND